MFVLTIDTDNAAFDGLLAPEVARILRDAAQRIQGWGLASHAHAIRDTNGNTVGSYGHGPAADRILADASGSNMRHILASLRERLRQYDDKMGDAENEGRDSRPPEGDDYNEIYSEVMHTLNRILEG